MKAALTTAIITLALIGNPAYCPADDKEVLTEELLLSIFDGEKSNAGRAARLLKAATSLARDKKTKIALLKKSIEYGFKSMSLAKARSDISTALRRLREISDIETEDSYLTDKSIEFHRICYRQYSRNRLTKLESRSNLIAALCQGARHAERANKWSDVIKTYTEVVRLAARPASPDLPSFRRKVKRATHMRKVQQLIDLSTKQLKADGDNVKARTTLVTLFLVEHDDPAEASKYLNDDVDAIMQTYIPLALIKPFEVKLSACKEMAKWYGQVLAKDASVHAKPLMLRRAIAYCDRFLNSPKRADEGALLLGVIRGNLKKELTALNPDPAPKPKLETLAGGTITLNLGKGISMKLRGIPPKKVFAADRLKGKMVAASPFYIGVTEVTQEQYQAVMQINPSHYKGPKHPAEQVSWHDAREFCKKLSVASKRTVRLPTEAEWAHANYAGAPTEYFFGNDSARLGDYAWFKTNTKDLGPAGDHHRPVATKKPNSWGLYDTQGNVWEWVFDSHEPERDETKTPARKLPKDIRKACGGDWVSMCVPETFAWSGAAGRFKGWGFRVLVEYE
jgi:formylglycine-generating enzyme required for sulfatase activity